MALDGQTGGLNELKRVLRSVGIYAGVFLAGGVVAFVYSYAPLHSAQNWKIGYLEERLQAKDEQVGMLEQELAQARGEATRKADPETLEQLRKELAKTDKTIGELERELSRAKRQAKDFERSRDSWKARHAEMESKLTALTSDGGNEPAAADSAALRPPAAPAPSPGDESVESTSEPAEPVE